MEAQGFRLTLPDAQKIEEAAGRIAALIRRTPVRRSDALDARLGAELFFKCENEQRCGAFKLRGAANAVLSLSEDEARAGVATHSSGNHAQALAYAARARGIEAHVVMPSDAPRIKREACAGWGARIIECAPTLEARERTLEAFVRSQGSVVIHPYDDLRVIAGQGTVARELLAQIPELDAIVAPLGGGGLLSGTAIAAAADPARPAVWGAEPANADDAHRSLGAGALLPSLNPTTIADGLRTSLCPRTFRALRELSRGVLLASEAEILEAMRLIWLHLEMRVEPSAAVPLAALLAQPRPIGRRIGLLVSGGNVDVDRFAAFR
ncbi:MAG: pyridoxal-phosphate dependent enzyme [Myxococcales bacterium]|nr:pyridoxal-phosphate dependent enzyme [Myxococcales bacterium]